MTAGLTAWRGLKRCPRCSTIRKGDPRKHRQRLEALITEGSDSKVPPDTSDEELVNMVAQYLPLGPAERQDLLELKSALLRARALIELIEAKKTKPRFVD